MSVFNVEAVLKERPELWGILGKKMICDLQYAGVMRINAGFLSQDGYRSPCFIVSHDGLLLAKVATGPAREMFSWVFPGPESLLDAVRRVGAQHVAYIAQYDFGCDDVGAPRALYIHKAPTQGLAELVRSFAEDATKGLVA